MEYYDNLLSVPKGLSCLIPCLIHRKNNFPEIRVAFHVFVGL